MCGIVATVGMDPRIVNARGPEALRLLAHRGPDDEGLWSDEHAWLGHRRLSIIDLTAAGHQPMVHEPSGVVITCNGEIYNYLELRAELELAGHRFSTRSDTEVLLVAYLEWGEACLARLNGMWSFLIWDPRSHKAFFARDRLGVKPLCFSFADGGLSVASEPKALLALYPELRHVDEAALYTFLAEGQLYTGGRSFYDGIHVLQAGHYGTFEPGAASPAIHRYWAPPVASNKAADYRECVREFGDLLEDSVRLRMRSDVPVGFTLSGGLDSSAVLQAAVLVAGSAGARLQAFTSVYANPPGTRIIDERHWAALVAGKYERVDLEQVLAGDNDWLELLERIVWHMDGPGYSPAVFPLWRIMRRARAAGVPVLLEGQGGDELLGGYAQYAALALWDSLSRLRLGTFPRDFRSYARTFSARLLTLWFARERLSFVKGAYRRRVGSLGTMDPEFVRRFNGNSPVRPSKTVNGRLEADLTRDILPGLLHYGDAISMAHSIESRFPFLDYRLVEFAASLPGDFKVGGGETKRILRDHLRAVNLQEIADRRDKQGYPTPADAWLRADGGAILRSVLLSPSAAIRAYCNPKRLERLIDHHVSGGRGAGNHLYRLLTTEMWLRTCIARTPGMPVEVKHPAVARSAW
jgi:asparagine synthase (glutamine-hydrolysing)